MLLQLAIDYLNEEDALAVAGKTSSSIDIVEIGTPLIKSQGLNIVTHMKEKYPHLPIFVDLKTMDAGEYEVTPFVRAGAKYVTVLGAADIGTVAGATKAAHDHGAHIVVDLIVIENKIQRIKELSHLPIDFFNIHTGIDQQAQGKTPMGELKEIKSAFPQVKLFVAGGISSRTIDEIVPLKPDVIVVGGGITQSPDPENAAKMIKNAMKKSYK